MVSPESMGDLTRGKKRQLNHQSLEGIIVDPTVSAYLMVKHQLFSREHMDLPLYNYGSTRDFDGETPHSHQNIYVLPMAR